MEMRKLVKNMIDPKSPTFGLPPCIRVPIAATDASAIETYVGRIMDSVESRSGVIQALLVKPYVAGEPAHPQAPLWRHIKRDEFILRLFPVLQVWVHVDYRKYRSAYIHFGMPPIPDGYVLDHIQNREAIRLSWYSQPYLRLCPVSREVNSSGGNKTGPEGMEKDNLLLMQQSKDKLLKLRKLVTSYQIMYADPVVLTKMLNISTGTKELPGVAKMLKLFYAD
jgi:hypothetical protein